MPEEPPHIRRLAWEDVADQARRVVESLVGQVSASASSRAGLNSRVAATLHVPGGKVFVKGLPSSHRNVAKQGNEAGIGSRVHGISPRVLHHVNAGDWNFLIFEHFEGRHANLSPGTSDLAVIGSTLQELLVRRAHDSPVAMPIEERWARFNGDLDLSLLAGDSLVHTDLNPRNILVGADRSALVDWALPGKGASWLNIAFMVSSLISEGFLPQQAENWAGQFTEWNGVDAYAIDTFAAAIFRRRQEQAAHCPERRRTERQRLAYLARTWLNHRRRLSTSA